MGLIAALHFLTAIPVAPRRTFSDAELGASLAYYPLAGALLGVLLALLATLWRMLFAGGTAAALTLAAWVLLTGGLHHDGLMDACDGLFSDLAGRELNFRQSHLNIIDGSKALRAGVRKYCGEASPILRCQIHKRRNIVGHFAEEDQPGWDRRLANAYDLRSYREAKAALLRVQAELNQVNPSAARSLEEGMEETLTLHRLKVPVELWKTLRSTNVIESAFSIVRIVCRNVKRWRPGNQIERWIGSGLLVAEKQFRRIDGHRALPDFLAAIDADLKAPKSGTRVA